MSLQQVVQNAYKALAAAHFTVQGNTQAQQVVLKQNNN